MIRSALFSLLCLGLSMGLLSAVEIPRSPELPKEMPWDLKQLAVAPKFEWTDTKAPLKALLYAGEKFQGKPSRVFAYYGTPAMFDPAQKGPWPGIVLVHGGGGTAFPRMGHALGEAWVCGDRHGFGRHATRRH